MRRICLVGAVAASMLVVGVATSSAKKSHHKTTTPVATLKGTCKLAMSIVVPTGETVVLQDATNGTMYGTSTCSGKSGVVSFPFNVASSGDTVGSMTLYSGTGSLKGTADLSETSSSPPTPYVFGNAVFSGTFKVKKGTGSWAGASGHGTFACVTPDSIHYNCTLKLK
jgi:hypothetical protein